MGQRTAIARCRMARTGDRGRRLLAGGCAVLMALALWLIVGGGIAYANCQTMPSECQGSGDNMQPPPQSNTDDEPASTHTNSVTQSNSNTPAPTHAPAPP